MTKKLGVAGLQLKKDFINEDNNINHFERVCKITKVNFPWIDLIFTGELYCQKSSIKSADSIPNELTNRLSELSKKLNCWLVPGSFFEKEDSKIYNTLLVFNPDGEIVAKYRKIFPWMPNEGTDWGTEFVTFDIPNIGRVGVVICYDLWFPEVFRTLTWMGADVILLPSRTWTSDQPAELVLARAHAIMFQCYVLSVTAISPPYGGGSSIFIDPEGRILQSAGTSEKVMTEIIDFEKVNWVRQYGSFGMNPLWKSFRDSPLKGKFPPYDNLMNGEVFNGLTKLELQNNIRNHFPKE
ncbi:MAG: carbon-nitrogen hydrolase family protein [Candidatus Hodarchaeales archaeon]|jgi:predicted amidohydrolase